MKAGAIVEINKEDSSETKYLKIPTFPDNANKPKEYKDNAKTAQTIYANPQIAQTQSKT
jgi:hypothetical protein